MNVTVTNSMQPKFAQKPINKHHNNIYFRKAVNCTANVTGSRR